MNTKTKLILSSSFAVLLFSEHSASAGIFTYTPFTGDADSGILSGLSYTAKADFNGSGTRTVNGVLFSDNGFSGTGYSLSGPDGALVGGADPNFVTGESFHLVNDFVYGNLGNASLTLSGLTIGEQYVTSWYNRTWGLPGGRFVDITTSDTNSTFRLDENFNGAGNGNVLRYSFTATASTISYSFNAVSDGDSFHHYAMTNAVRNDSLLTLATAPVAPAITAISGAGPLVPFTISSTDLLQTNLAGVSSSGGTFNLEGTGGVPILNNGAFSITGIGGNNPELATGVNNSSVTFTLDTSVNTLGYDVSSIEGFGGWNDAGRDRQLYSVYFSTVGSAAFDFLGTVNYDPAAGGIPSAVRAVFSTALTGVDEIRIDFLDGQENGHAGYGEFDVIGAASVPEPASAGLLLMAGAGLLARRRRA